MSPKAHIPSHRKPRTSNKAGLALRAGVTGGVMGTIALTTAAAPGSAADKHTKSTTETGQMRTLSVAGSSAEAADSLKNSAQQQQVQHAQHEAAVKAQHAAADTKEKAEAQARAAAKRKAEAAHKKAAQTASRSTDRPSLTDAPVSGHNASALISFLRAQVGKSYVMGATGPSSYDCSGLTQAAFKRVGVNLPRTSQPQSTAGKQVGLDSLQPGDLLYWGSAGSAYHVGVYVGGGKFIGAQNSSTGVVEKPLSYDQPTGAVRVL